MLQVLTALLYLWLTVAAFATSVTTTGAGKPTAVATDFPTIASSIAGSNTSATTHTITMPSGVGVGDLILVCIGFGGAAANTVTAPAEFSELFLSSAGTTRKAYVGYKVSEGDEGASVSMTTANSASSGYVVYRIEDYTGTPEITTATATTANPDPPSETASWGSDDNLFISCVNTGITPDPITSAPANYDGLLQVDPVAAGGHSGGAHRFLTAASDDPGTWTLPESTTTRAHTIVVQPN